MSETFGAALLVVGLVLGASGYIWLLFTAFHTGEGWGLAIFFLPPLALLFALVHLRKALPPLLLVLGGAALTAAPFLASAYLYDLGPREREVDGELHITLTGWDRDDYSILRAKPGTVVLQMANADVDDSTLENLRGMTGLRELDLNDTGVTDEGLRILGQLPKLETLRLRKTKITDQGFREFLRPLESLRELDLRGTKVASATVRAWKAAQPNRKVLR
jgi:Leucine-rich repeat (LRR) protein